MNGRMNIHDVVGVKTSTSTFPNFNTLEIIVTTSDGSTIEVTLFSDDISKLEIKHANEN
jgi:hypothetical protein